MLAQKIRSLRESKGLVQRVVANQLDIDIAYVSKMEHGEKPISRNYLKTLSRLYDVPLEELQTLWLADKLLAIAKGDSVALQAMEMVQGELKHQQIQKRK